MPTQPQDTNHAENGPQTGAQARDTCRVVETAAGPIRVHGSTDPSPAAVDALGVLVAAVHDLMADAEPGTAPECPSAGYEDSRQAPNPPSLAPDATPGILSPQNASQQRTHREPQCPKCKTIWRQRGNATGHCRACCRTFDSLDAFDHHRVDGSCIDPAAWTRGDGTPLFESRTSTEGLDAGTTYWRMVPHPAAARWIEERRASHADSDR